jgi:glycosyltransferase involved in cell wall biosynthesis
MSMPRLSRGIGNADSPHRDDLVLVSHDATRTGAPRVAIEILRSWTSLPGHRHVILKGGGPLLAEFKAWSDHLTMHSAPFRESLWRLGFKEARRGPSAFAGWFDVVAARRLLRFLRPTLVYANTLVSADYAWAASELGVPSILHCHELGSYIPTFVRRYRLRRLPENVSLVAVSTAVQRTLAETLGRDVSRIKLIPPPVDVTRVQELASQDSSRLTLLPQDALLVTGCGTVDERKGSDLWLEMAKLVLSSAVPERVFFVWIGEGSWLAKMRKRADRMGLNRRVFFIGGQENPYPLLSRSAVFTLTSRWDPFPIAVLEAMALGVPVVAFRAGGVAEQLGGRGILCGPGEVQEMAAHVVRLLNEGAEGHMMVKGAQERVSGLYDVAQFRSRVQNLVRETLSAPAGAEASLP